MGKLEIDAAELKGLWFRVAPEFAQSALVANNRKGVGKVMKTGKVVYVHPKGRYVTMEFKGVKGMARECFYPKQLGQPVAAPREA